MRPRLLLTLATHNPVVGVLLLHLAVLAAQGRGPGFRALDPSLVLQVILIYWAPVFAWEIARKIRSPREEGSYVTYSRLLGPLGAVVLVAAAQTVAAGLWAAMAYVHGFSFRGLACVGLGWAIAQAAHLRFLRQPDPRTSQLRPFAELFLLAVLLAGFLA
jgi:hypothetical protein